MPPFRKSWLWCLPPAFGLGLLGGFLAARPLETDSLGGGEEIDFASVRNARTLQDLEDPAPPPSAIVDPKSRLGILERLAAANLADLPALSRELLEGESDYTLKIALYDRWVELDPQAGFDFFTRGTAESQSGPWRYACSAYCGRWAIRDPDGALVAAQSLDDPWERDTALGGIFPTLAQRRPADFFRVLAALGDDSSFRQRLSDAARAFGLSDPAAALAAINALDPELRRHYGVAADLAIGWAKTDPEGALAWARELVDPDERRRSLRAIAGRLLSSDPDRAGAVYRESGSLEEASDGMAIGGEDYDWKIYDWPRLARQLAQTDPEGAVAWIAKHFPDKAADFIPNILPQDALSALDAVAQLPDAVLNNGKLTGWPGADWRPIDVESALARLDGIANPVTRESMHAWLLGAQAFTDPGGAIITAMGELTDPENRGHVLKSGMATWARNDLAAASEWLATRPPGVETDGAIGSLVEVAKHSEPQAALSWALTISESESRIFQLYQVYWSWQKIDPNAASAALGAVSLNETDRAALTERGVRFSE